MPVLLSARLSSQSTSTLSKILELTRLHQNSLVVPEALPKTISRNLLQLKNGLSQLKSETKQLERRGGDPERGIDIKREKEVLADLESQYERLVGLVDGLNVDVPAADEEEQEDQADQEEPRQENAPPPYRDYPDNGNEIITLQPQPSSSSRKAGKYYDDEESELGLLSQRRSLEEENHEASSRTNRDIMEMQQQIFQDQNDQLDSLSIAISRQRDISRNISEELELQSTLLDETDNALDNTASRLNRANNNLGRVRKNALKDNGATWTIVALVVILLVLVLVFKT